MRLALGDCASLLQIISSPVIPETKGKTLEQIEVIWSHEPMSNSYHLRYIKDPVSTLECCVST